ncbi:MAG: DUF502 domain-containing protein [Methyloceanibacter sp.]
MKSILPYLRTTLMGGLLFLVPITALVIVLGKALGLAHKLMDPLAVRIPVESVMGLRTPMLLGIVVIVLFCFFAGLFARTALAQKIVHGLEEAVLSKIPGYEMLKSTGESIVGVENQKAYSVVLVRFDEAWQIGLRIEELQNGLLVIYIPGAPDPLSGSVYFMTSDRVVPTRIPIAATLKCLKGLGGGANTLLHGLSGDTMNGPGFVGAVHNPSQTQPLAERN